jgi:hypothetical protein
MLSPIAASAASVLAPLSPAVAGDIYAGHGRASAPSCPDLSSGERRGSTLNIFKPVIVNKTTNIFKPVVINKSVDIGTINKNVVINKNVLVNKVDAIPTAQGVGERSGY